MLLLIIFIILVVFYFVVAIKVNEWIVISALGFKSFTPAGFLRNPRIYVLVKYYLFMGALAVSFFLPIRWYVCLVVLLVLWVGANSIGRKLAFRSYRHSFSEIANDETNPASKADYILFSKKSDKELLELARQRF